jgi:hypothetical protein
MNINLLSRLGPTTLNDVQRGRFLSACPLMFILSVFNNLQNADSQVKPNFVTYFLHKTFLRVLSVGNGTE